MMELGPNAAFVWASYAVVAVVLAAAVIWLAVDGRRQTRRLEQLGERGISRRSARPSD